MYFFLFMNTEIKIYVQHHVINFINTKIQNSKLMTLLVGNE